MTQNQGEYQKFDHNEYARNQDKSDFWGQIRRTVQGRPVSEEHIAMIVAAINTALQLSPDDTLLDLACGNGALSSRLFYSCKNFLGVDSAEFLIQVAKENFEREPEYRFTLDDATNYLRTEKDPGRFTKSLCYGSFSYFSEEQARTSLSLLFTRFPNISRVFIGNLPDRDRKSLFFTRSVPLPEELLDHTTAIGIWRTRQEFLDLGTEAGWRVTFSQMPAEFYASAYRYDVILTRP